MRVSAILAALASLALGAAFAPGAADAQRITVVKGGESTVIDTGQRRPGVTVERGDIPGAAEPAPDSAGAYPLPPPPDWRLVGGRNFWFYNEDKELLIGCRLVGTAMVGRHNKRVKCTAPRHAPKFHGYYN